MTNILHTKSQCSLTQHSLQVTPRCLALSLAASASLGCMYGRPSVMECDMHYARVNVQDHGKPSDIWFVWDRTYHYDLVSSIYLSHSIAYTVKPVYRDQH